MRLARLGGRGLVREIGTGPQDPKRRYVRAESEDRHGEVDDEGFRGGGGVSVPAGYDEPAKKVSTGRP
jgi:hypothetical protein